MPKPTRSIKTVKKMTTSGDRRIMRLETVENGSPAGRILSTDGERVVIFRLRGGLGAACTTQTRRREDTEKSPPVDRLANLRHERHTSRSAARCLSLPAWATARS